MLLLGGAGVDHDLLGSHGPVAGLEFQRAEARVGGIDARAQALLGHGFAVAADDVGRVDLGRRHCAPGRLDLGQCAHLGEQRRRDSGRAARGLLHDLLACDHGVGPLVGGREQPVERLLHRVGEDERAAHHRDADHDSEGGQQRADLAGRETLQSDSDHRPLTSSSTSRMRWALQAPMSRAMFPSARNSTRSAIAAACASWVTITVV